MRSDSPVYVGFLYNGYKQSMVRGLQCGQLETLFSTAYGELELWLYLSVVSLTFQRRIIACGQLDNVLRLCDPLEHVSLHNILSSLKP